MGEIERRRCNLEKGERKNYQSIMNELDSRMEGRIERESLIYTSFKGEKKRNYRMCVFTWVCQILGWGKEKAEAFFVCVPAGCMCVSRPGRMFSERPCHTERESCRRREEEGRQQCPRNLQMKREGFSLNAIKFFHFTASLADSFSSLVVQCSNSTLSSTWEGRGGVGWEVGSSRG